VKETLDSILVSITGGLGNQRFQLANGISVERRLNSRVKLGYQEFVGATARSFQLDFARNIPGGEIIPENKTAREIYIQARWACSKEVSAFKPHTYL